MALSSGTKLGPYEILAPLGAGGMGEVYRARDTRLERTVAIKILPQHLSSSQDLRQRFDREARAISSLNHPRICTLHDVGHQDGADFLVMEYLEGETLAERLRKGALPVREAFKIAIEVCEALDAAHRAGMVHRDLKPSNIMLTKGGAKLMDFGLAKPSVAGSGGSQGAVLLSAAATVSGPSPMSPLTATGQVLGTIQYMSPEQIEGKEAGARSDIFTFGAVLYEMVTGKRAFEGQSQLTVASAILEKDPPPMKQAAQGVPAGLERTIAICMAKDQEQRWSTAHDVLLQLKMLASAEAGSSEAVATRASARAMAGVALLALLAGAGGVAILARWTRPAQQSGPAMRFSIAFPKEQPMALANPAPTLAIAPDGSAIAYVAALRPSRASVGDVFSGPPAAAGGFVMRTEGDMAGSEAAVALYVRRMDQSAPERVPGSEEALNPFFSPDSQWLGWFARGAMKKAMLKGGAPITVSDVTTIYMGGAYWAPDGFIYFTPADLMRIPAAGGKAEMVAKVDTTKDANYQSPQLLPGGKAVLLTRRPLNITAYDQAVIFAYRLDTHESVTLVEGGSAGKYLPSGHLLYARGGSFFAAPFDAAKLRVLGPPVEVLRGGMFSENSGNATLDVSDNGTLAYAPGGLMQYDNVEVVGLNRSGAVRVLSPKPRAVAEPAVSPDGQNIALTIRAANDDIWLLNPGRGAYTRFTFAGGDNQVAIWSGDGSHVIYSRANRTRNLFWKPVNGGPEERLTTGDTVQLPDSTTPDGKLLAFTQWTGANADIYVLPLDGAHTPRPLIATRFNEQDGKFSPDGRWLAFVSDESGRNEVYVQPFGREGARAVVSTGGGVVPMWEPDGKRLYYSAGEAMMQADFDPATGNVGQATAAFHLPPRTVIFAITPGGDFIGVRTLSENQTAPEVEIATDWFRELSPRVPAPR